MKISSWNIRGFNDTLKQQEVVAFIRENKLDILGLMETKIKVDKKNKLIQKLFQNYRVETNYVHQSGFVEASFLFDILEFL